jgi:hypothetical protein
MAASIEHLETLIDRLSAHGPLTTSIVLSTPVTRRIITQIVGDLEDVEVEVSA